MLQQLFPDSVNLQRFLNSFIFSFVCLCAYVTDSYWIYCKLQKWIWKSDEKAVKGEKAVRVSVRVCESMYAPRLFAAESIPPHSEPCWLFSYFSLLEVAHTLLPCEYTNWYSNVKWY